MLGKRTEWKTTSGILCKRQRELEKDQWKCQQPSCWNSCTLTSTSHHRSGPEEEAWGWFLIAWKGFQWCRTWTSAPTEVRVVQRCFQPQEHETQLDKAHEMGSCVTTLRKTNFTLSNSHPKVWQGPAHAGRDPRAGTLPSPALHHSSRLLPCPQEQWGPSFTCLSLSRGERHPLCCLKWNVWLIGTACLIWLLVLGQCY